MAGDPGRPTSWLTGQISALEAVLDTPPHNGRILRVGFWRVKDRFAHAVWCLPAGTPQTLPDWGQVKGDEPAAAQRAGWAAAAGWFSVEGDDQHRWPPSPPLQQLSVQQLAGGSQVALLVGMAGRSHWSLSVLVDLDSASLVFDVACRATELPELLGSSYALAGPDGLAPHVSPAEPDARTTFSSVADQATFAPRAAPSQLPATWQWGYRWQLA